MNTKPFHREKSSVNGEDGGANDKIHEMLEICPVVVVLTPDNWLGCEHALALFVGTPVYPQISIFDDLVSR